MDLFVNVFIHLFIHSFIYLVTFAFFHQLVCWCSDFSVADDWRFHSEKSVLDNRLRLPIAIRYYCTQLIYSQEIWKSCHVLVAKGRTEHAQ